MNQAKYSDYKMQFAKEKYERIPLDVPKGQKDAISGLATQIGETRNEFIKKSIQIRSNEITKDMSIDNPVVLFQQSDTNPSTQQPIEPDPIDTPVEPAPAKSEQKPLDPIDEYIKRREEQGLS